ncbi:MAG: hypothetical protein ACM4AI_25235 [Acidobacteriota bacterium]
MDQRLFLWGLLNGAMMPALAGAFWIDLSIGMVANLLHGSIAAFGTLVQVSVVVG